MQFFFALIALLQEWPLIINWTFGLQIEEVNGHKELDINVKFTIQIEKEYRVEAVTIP